MRTIKQVSKKPSKLLIGGIIAVALVGLGSLAYWYYTTRNASESVATPPSQTNTDYSAPTDDQKSAGSAIKEQVASGQDQTSTPSSSVSITITSTDTSSDTLYIRTLIQRVTNEGSCTLAMSGPNGKTYSATTKVQAAAASSTCTGFDVPTKSLSSGQWKITVTYTDGGASGAASSEVTL